MVLLQFQRWQLGMQKLEWKGLNLAHSSRPSALLPTFQPPPLFSC